MLNSSNNQDRVYYKESFRDALAIGAGWFPGDTRYQTYWGGGSTRARENSSTVTSIGARYCSAVYGLLERSLQYSRSLSDRLSSASVARFAEFEIEETASLTGILKDMRATSSPEGINAMGMAMPAAGIDQAYVSWQMENHLALQAITKDYLQQFPAYATASDRQIWQLATLALAPFDEHLVMLDALCLQLQAP